MNLSTLKKKKVDETQLKGVLNVLETGQDGNIKYSR